MSERHSRQNRHAGSVRGRARVPRGGAQHVRPEDTLGYLGGCWCEGSICHPDPERPGHNTWPGEQDGAPHPRVSQRNEEERMATEDRIDRRSMRKWERPVQDLVVHLVNTEGIKFRWLEAGHLALYPPDGVSRPFKIAASRPAEMQVEYIRKQFMAAYGIAGPDGTVPHAPSEAEEVAVEASTSGPDPSAIEALRALTAALGVEVGGVSEEEFLAVVAEKDACVAESVRMQAEFATERDDLTLTIQALTEQRDLLLGKIENAREALS